MTKYNTINRYLFVFMAIMLLAASMLFGTKVNLKLHAEEEITDLTGTTWQITTGDIKFDQVAIDALPNKKFSVTIGFTIDETLSEMSMNYGTFIFQVMGTWNLIWSIIDNTGNRGGNYYYLADYSPLPVVDGYYVLPAEYFTDQTSEKKLGGIKLTFDGTGDTTNAFLIDWLQTNATLVPAQEPSTGVVVDVMVMSLSSLVALLTLSVLLVNNHKKQKI